MALLIIASIDFSNTISFLVINFKIDYDKLSMLDSANLFKIPLTSLTAYSSSGKAFYKCFKKALS